jgi:CRISPR-associated protein Csx14
VETILAFLADAKVHSIAPAGSKNSTEPQVPTRILSHDNPFPFPDPESPATLPAILEGRVSVNGPAKRLVIEYWGEDRRTGRDNAKFWAGMAGYAGAAIARDALSSVRSSWRDALADPFNHESEQSSSFRFDWRRDYIPIDIGFSLNAHGGRIAAVGFPFVEVLAALGLGSARPLRLSKLEYRYGVLGIAPGVEPPKLLPPPFLRAALGAVELPLPMKFFRMQLGYPGKEGQARAIKAVIEETGGMR